MYYWTINGNRAIREVIDEQPAPMEIMLVKPHLDYAVEFWFPCLNRNITHNIVRLNQMARGLENTSND